MADGAVPYVVKPRARPRARMAGAVFGLAAALLMLGTGVAYLASSGATASSVVTTKGVGTGGTGSAVSVTTLSVPITVSRGHAELDAGLEMARIDLASGSSGTLLVNVDWIDPQDAVKALQSPKSYILAGLYQEDTTATDELSTTGSCGSGEFKVTDPTNGTLCLELLTAGGNTLGVLTRKTADGVLQAPISGLTAVYVLGSIYVNDNIAHGQQGTLPDLQFYVSAQLAG